MLFLFFVFATSFAAPTPNQELFYLTKGSPTGNSTAYNGTTDYTSLNLLGLAVIELLQLDLVGFGTVFSGGKYYTTDDGLVNLSPIYNLGIRDSFDGSKLNETAILAKLNATAQLNGTGALSVELEEILRICVEVHNKAVWLVEVYKCGTSPQSTYEGCVNFTDIGNGTNAAYQDTIFNYAKVAAVRFFQASVEMVGRIFFPYGVYNDFIFNPTQTISDIYKKFGTPQNYTSAPSQPRPLDPAVLDWTLSMRPDVSGLDNPSILKNASANNCIYHGPQTVNMSASANRRINMLRRTVKPFHSAIRPEYQNLAAAQDLKAAQLNLTTYGNLLAALGLSSTGHPNPSANAFVGALLDTNLTNSVAGYQSWALPGGTAVPLFPKVAYQALFQRAHEAILADPDGTMVLYQSQWPWTQNHAFDVLENDVHWIYYCYVDPLTGICSTNALWAWGMLEGFHFWQGADIPSFPYSYLVRYVDHAALHFSLEQILSFVFWDNSDFDLRTVLAPEPTTGRNFLNRGIGTCFPALIYGGGRDYGDSAYCGNCAY